MPLNKTKQKGTKTKKGTNQRETKNIERRHHKPAKEAQPSSVTTPIRLEPNSRWRTPKRRTISVVPL